ncbi:hypothetical protein EXE10_18280 [Acinetobacter sp. WCHAc060033]|uniref:hypothetical protein n=1 Tax=Acinetobacter sp. WCHAc060033 TaxID=2518624 RepID=UPI00102327B0|nr:hypothetical protein [Acinetobacter sp. WCHAc060033]RZG78368.1 hypothetical protein EXE10_18280 [Acinetobacter sp. WCHAc060033]
MTTTSNLSIEQMREIVESAPDRTATHCVINTGVNYYSLSFGSVWDHDIDDWNDSDYRYTHELIKQFGENSVFDLNDLRTAITEHDKAWLEKRFGIKKWYPIPEHHMCVDKRLADMTDDCTDIRNHVSPSTIVTDLHINETDKLNRLG